jgi:hypothetical protein
MGDEPRVKYGSRETPLLDGAVLYRVGTNEEKWFSQAQLTAALQSGEWLGKKGETVQLVSDTGSPYRVDASQAAERMRGIGGGAESQEGINERRYQEKMRARYGSGVGNQFEAWSEGALRGLSFGTYDAFAVKVLGEDPEGLINRRKFWSKTALAGEIFAGVTGALASGGTSILGKGAAKYAIPAVGIPRLAMGTGEAIAGAATRRLAGRELATAGGTLAARGLGTFGRASSMAIGGAIDAAAYGAGTGLSTWALSGDPFTTDAVLSEMGTGAVHGAKYGALIGGSLSLLADGWKATWAWSKGSKDVRATERAERMSSVKADASARSTTRAAYREQADIVRKNERAINHLDKEEAKIIRELEREEERAYRKAATTDTRLEKAQEALEREGYSVEQAAALREERAVADLKREVLRKESKLETGTDILERIKARRAHLGESAAEKVTKETKTNIERLRKAESTAQGKVEKIQEELKVLDNTIERQGQVRLNKEWKKAQTEEKRAVTLAEKNKWSERMQRLETEAKQEIQRLKLERVRVTGNLGKAKKVKAEKTKAVDDLAEKQVKTGTAMERLEAVRLRRETRRSAMEEARETAASVGEAAERTELGHMIKGYDEEAGLLHKLAHKIRQNIEKTFKETKAGPTTWDKPLQDAAEASVAAREEFGEFFVGYTGVRKNGARVGRHVIDYPTETVTKWAKTNQDLYDQAILTIDELERTTVNLHRELHRVMPERAAAGKKVYDLDPLYENFKTKFGLESDVGEILRSHRRLSNAVESSNTADAVAAVELLAPGGAEPSDVSAVLPVDIPGVAAAADVLAGLYAAKRIGKGLQRRRLAKIEEQYAAQRAPDTRRLPTTAEMNRSKKLRELEVADTDLAASIAAKEAGPGKIVPKGIPEELEARYRQAQRNVQRQKEELQKAQGAQERGYEPDLPDPKKPKSARQAAQERAQRMNEGAQEYAEETKKAREAGVRAAKEGNTNTRAKHERDLKNARIRLRQIETEMEELGVAAPGKPKKPKRKPKGAKEYTKEAAIRGVAQGLYTKSRSVVGHGVLGTVVSSLFGNVSRVVMRKGLGTKVADSYVRQAKKINLAVEDFIKPAGGLRRVTPRHGEEILDKVSFWIDGEEPKSEVAIGKGYTKLQKSYLKRAEELHNMMGNREAMAENLNYRLSKLYAMDPRIAMDLEIKIHRRLTNIYSRMPKSPRMGSIASGFRDYVPPDYKIRKWARYIAVAEEPLLVLSRMSDSRLTKIEVDSIRDNYVEIYNRVQAQIVERLTDSMTRLPHRKLMQLSLLWGLPATTSMRPDFVGVLQSSYVPTPETEEPTADLSRVRQSTEQQKTNFQRVTAK